MPYIVGNVDKKAMIRNRYNRIPHPALNTKREMSSVSRSLTPVAYLTFPPWNAVVVPGRDRSGMNLIYFVGGVSWAYM